MKKEILVLLSIILLLFSCKKEKNEPLPAPTVQEEMVANEFQIVCYQGIKKKDTINLSLEINENQEVKGELSYLFFEKDKSKGVISGKMFGDTLKGNYIFMSEGVQSSREIVFLRKGKIMIEAYGDVEVADQKTVFKNARKLFFDSATVLTETDCLQAK